MKGILVGVLILISGTVLLAEDKTCDFSGKTQFKSLCISSDGSCSLFSVDDKTPVKNVSFKLLKDGIAEFFSAVEELSYLEIAYHKFKGTWKKQGDTIVLEGVFPIDPKEKCMMGCTSGHRSMDAPREGEQLANECRSNCKSGNIVQKKATQIIKLNGTQIIATVGGSELELKCKMWN